ncbi:MAG: ABC transporter permease [Bacteroidota bacterium]
MKNHPHPPRLFRRLLAWFCHPDFYEELEGDLEENFIKNADKKGLHHARWIYRKEVLLLLRPSVVKSLRFSFWPSHTIDLWRNHGKIAMRSLLRHKLFSGINILGLAASMSLGLIVIGMVHDLLQFDEFHEQKEQIYRVISKPQIGSWHDERASAVLPLAEYLKTEISGVEEVVRIQRRFGGEVEANGKLLPLSGYFTDPAFLEIFTFPLLKGNAKTALQQPFSVVITDEVVQRVFNGANPIGKEIEVGEMGRFQITGVLKNIPKESHLQFEMLASFSTLPGLEKAGLIRPSLEQWDELSSSYIYLKLAPDRLPEEVVAAMNRIGANAYESFENLQVDFGLQALASIVPGRDLSDQIGPKMVVLPIVILAAIALLVLLSACFNYTNLSIARSLRRGREVGIRKVVGATRGQVSQQFLIEAVVITLLSLVLSIGIFETIKEGFMQTIPRADQLLTLELTPTLVLFFVAFALLAGLLAGLVPATVLSKMHPANLVKQYFPQKLMKKMSVRRALIVFQFAISLFFIGAATIVFQQHHEALHHDMGFDQENILNISLQGVDETILKNELSKFPEVTDVSFSSLVIGVANGSLDWVRQTDQGDSIGVHFVSVDHRYVPNHGLDFLAGKNFTENQPASTHAQIIINEEMAHVFNWRPDEAIGQVLEIGHQPHQVIGVLEDFHYRQIEEPINSFFFRYDPDQFTYANIKLQSQNIPATMATLRQAWDKLDSRHDFKAAFFDQQIEEAYFFLVNVLRIFGFLSFIAISIACLGLLGMAVYTIEVKLKEISIRKVFGANDLQVVSLLSSGFVKMLLIAAVIALPLTFLLFDKVVLRQFAFRIEIGVVELGFGVVVLLLLGLLTIGSQTWKAARRNPAEVLKGE